jgi:tRNA 2-thiouridine synthesizing protein E
MERSTITFVDGKEYQLDRHGFLEMPHQWDEDFAEGMAKLLGIPGGLTDEHWSFISYLRKKFLEEGTVPVVVAACTDNKMRLSKLRHLFPTGYHRGACKIAGINYAFMYKTNIWLTYESYTTLQNRYKLTASGFLEDFNQWNENFAHLIINEWNISQGLTAKHKKIISFLREYYQKNNNIPTIYETCKINGISLAELRELFPDGYRRGACRIAGLPFFT